VVIAPIKNPVKHLKPKEILLYPISQLIPVSREHSPLINNDEKENCKITKTGKIAKAHHL